MLKTLFPFRLTSSWGFILGSLIVLALLTVRCNQALTSYASLERETAYVGIQACEPCHQKITQSYLETGMGKSLYRPQKENIIEKMGVVVFDTATDFHYQALWEDESMFIREFRLDGRDTIHQRKEKIDYIVGSGHQTRSYLLQRNGYLFEFPITWYVQKGIWDLSPGYDVLNSRFDREIGLECMACHTGHVELEPHTKNRYKFISEGIDCEKCHGPGSEHIQRINDGQLIDVGVEIDYSIVNPAKLPVDQQFDICQQCHLQGTNILDPAKEITDFRPAMRLRDIGNIFLAVNPDQSAFGIASHAERLKQSQCFLQSEGKLNCTACHDPHKSVNRTNKEIFVKQCQSCHVEGEQPLCAESEEAQLTMEGNCISCHMPKGGTSDIPHVSFHDHYIRVVKADSQAVNTQSIERYIQLVCGNEAEPDAYERGKAWLNYYEFQEKEDHYLTEAKALLSDTAAFERARIAFYEGESNRALSLVDVALGQKPNDIYIQFFKGQIMEQLGRPKEAYQIFQKLHNRQPALWDAGLKAGVNLLLSQQGDPIALGAAEQIFQNLLQQKPFDVRALSNMAFIKLNQGDIRQAERLLVKSLNLNPDHANSLENMVYLQALNQNELQAKLYLERFMIRHPNSARLASMRQNPLTSKLMEEMQ